MTPQHAPHTLPRLPSPLHVSPYHCPFLLHACPCSARSASMTSSECRFTLDSTLVNTLTSLPSCFVCVCSMETERFE